jgi:endonuclease/exonuclease/phosphatase family metal-dependent hydrolase
MRRQISTVLRTTCVFWAVLIPCSGETFRVATYNLEGYLDQPGLRRQAKSELSRAKIREIIRSASPDVLALQEVGSPFALRELTQTLKSEGLDYPHTEFISGADTNIHLSIVSRFPFTAIGPHTNEVFLLDGRRRRVSRGFGEVKVKVSEDYAFTLFTAHLKSRRAIPEADESEIRFAEAKLLREAIEARLGAEPAANVIVLGDLNDTKDSVVVRTIIGGRQTRLLDTRPAEQDTRPHDAAASSNARDVTWTHFFAQSDTYSRIDYILLSSGMAREWVADQTRIVSTPDWGLASDHRLLVATITAADQ